MNSIFMKQTKHVILISFIATFLVVILTFVNKPQPLNSLEEIPLREDQLIVEKKLQKPQSIKTKGIYLTMYTVSNPARLQHFIDLAKATDLNTFVIDMKDYSGRIPYNSQVAKEWKTNHEQVLIPNVQEMIDKIHQEGIYVIARVTVFQDPVLANRRPDLAVKNSQTKKPWQDYKGLTWLDPGAKEVWEYHTNLLKEIIAYGFDEVNLDYIRFPSDGAIALMQFTHLPETFEKRNVLKDFIIFVSEELKDDPAYLSVDLFGFVTTKNDDLQVGQVLEDFAPYVDYISPMVYPSHYPSGYMGYTNPALYPFEIINEAMKVASQRLEALENNRAQLRPWLQDFDIGANYTKGRIQREIDAVEVYPNAGWLMWNARNVFTEEIFQKE